MSSLIKDIRRLPSGTVVEAQGEISLAGQPDFQAAVLDVCKERPPVLALHLGQVQYMDSSGVGTLVKISHSVKAYGGRLILISPTSRVMSIFEITTLDKYFTIVDSENEALGA